MSKRNRSHGDSPPSDWDSERSLAAAEADVGDVGDRFACLCGHRELLVQGFFAIADGILSAEPVELEGLTCPECGREYEAVQVDGGRIARGSFVGFADLDDD